MIGGCAQPRSSRPPVPPTSWSARSTSPTVPARRAHRRARGGGLVPGPAAEQGAVPGEARAALHPRRGRGRHRRERAGVRAGAAGRRRAAVRRRERAGRRPRGVGVRAARQPDLRAGRRHPAELPDRALRPRRARRAAGRRDRAGARRRRRRRYRDHPGREGLGARVLAVVRTQEKAASSAPPAPTRSSCSTGSATPSPASPTVAASTSSSTWSAATASPTRCACSRPRAADGRRLRRRAGHPRGQGQPAAAQQRRRARGRLGRLRHGPAGLHAGAVGRPAAPDEHGRDRPAGRRDVRPGRLRAALPTWTTGGPSASRSCGRASA